MLQSKRGQTMPVTRRLVLTAVFAALAYAVMFVFRFKVLFLTFDLKDVVITLSGLILGPLTALTVSLLVAVLELITVSDTEWYGFLMNFASSAAFSVVCAVVYRYNKKLWGAIVALASGLVVMVATMMVLNLVVTPAYMHVERAEVVKRIPTLFLPFNIVKGTINAALVLILYKPIRRVLQATRMMPRDSASIRALDPAAQKRRVWVNVLVFVGGLALLAVGISVFYLVLNGEFEVV